MRRLMKSPQERDLEERLEQIQEHIWAEESALTAAQLEDNRQAAMASQRELNILTAQKELLQKRRSARLRPF